MTSEFIFKDWDKLRTSFDEANNKEEGCICFCIPDNIDYAWFIKGLKRFTDKYPDISFHIDPAQQFSKDEPIDMFVQIGKPENPDLITHKLFSGHHIFCATQDYLDRRGMPKSPRDLLANHAIIAPTQEDVYDIYLFLKCEEWHKKDPNDTGGSRLFVDNMSYMAVMTSCNNGVALMPDYLLRDYPQFVHVLKDYYISEYEFYLCYSKHVEGCKKITAFRDHIFKITKNINKNVFRPKNDLLKRKELPFDISVMDTFNKVVLCGGYVAAAAQMKVEPSVVRNQIKALEDYLGTAIFADEAPEEAACNDNELSRKQLPQEVREKMNYLTEAYLEETRHAFIKELKKKKKNSQPLRKMK